MTDDGLIQGTKIEDTIIPAGGSWSRQVNKGEILRIVVSGGQASGRLPLLQRSRHGGPLCRADTMKINPAGIFLSTGTVLYSVSLTPLFTIVQDTCGRHDTIGGCCSAALNTFRYGVGDQPNCRDNFLRELAKFGMGAKDIVANVNFFMYVPVGENGEMDMGPSISKAGDYVDLRAESDVLAFISNCPQINNPVNNYNPTPIRVVVRQPRHAPQPG